MMQRSTGKETRFRDAEWVGKTGKIRATKLGDLGVYCKLNLSILSLSLLSSPGCLSSIWIACKSRDTVLAIPNILGRVALSFLMAMSSSYMIIKTAIIAKLDSK